MLIFTKFFYIFLYINLSICDAVNRNDTARSDHSVALTVKNGVIQGEGTMITSKYLVYTGLEMENIGYHMLTVGSILRRDIVITNIALKNNEFRAIVNSVLQLSVNVFAFVVAGNTKFTSIPQKQYVYYASEMKSIHHFPFDEKFLINRSEFFDAYRMFPQISILKLTRHLPLDGIQMEALNLPINYDTSDTDCLVGGWGNLQNIKVDEESNRFFETDVKILNKEKCISIIPEYRTTLCIAPQRNQLNHCEILNGGEPLICSGNKKGLLIGVVSEMNPCEPTKPRPCASIIENLRWIEFQLYDRVRIKKSSQIRYIPFTKFYLLIFHVYLWNVFLHIIKNAKNVINTFIIVG